MNDASIIVSAQSIDVSYSLFADIVNLLFGSINVGLASGKPNSS